MKIELISNFSQLQPLRDEWNGLVLESYGKNVFLTYEWLSSWWSVYSEGRELAVLLAKEDNRLIGIAPLYLEDANVAGPVRVRQVCFLGDKFVGSDFLDFMALRQRQDEVIRLFVDFLLKKLSWHRLYLEDMREDSLTLAMLRTLSREHSLSFYVKRNFICPYLTMPESVDEFMKLPDSTFKRIAAKETAKLFKNSSVEVDYSVSSTIRDTNCATNDSINNDNDNDNGNKTSLDAYLERFFSLFAERWSDKEWRGFFEDEKMRTFYKTASKELADRDWLSLGAIKIDGAIEAMEYAMCFGDSYYFLLGGVSKKGRKLKAGNVLRYKTLVYLIGKAKVANFLRGHETYKYSWGCVDSFTVNVQIGRGGVGKLVSTYETMLHRAKAIIKAGLRKLKKGKKKSSH